MFPSQIDALILLITKNTIGIDPNSSDIPELISKHLWGFTPKEAYDKVVLKIPTDKYDTFELGNTCPNCDEHTFPCLNCAAYIYKYSIGYGRCNGIKQTPQKIIIRTVLSNWRHITKH